MIRLFGGSIWFSVRSSARARTSRYKYHTSMLFFRWWFVTQRTLACSPKTIDVFLGSGKLDFDDLFAIGILNFLCPTEVFARSVVSLCSPKSNLIRHTNNRWCAENIPGNIVEIAHRIHHQDVNIWETGCQEVYITFCFWNAQLGRRKRYWRKHVNMCHGSKCMKELMK